MKRLCYSILPKLAMLISVWLSQDILAQNPPRTNAYWQPGFAGYAGPFEYGASASCIDAQGTIYAAGNFQFDNKQPVRVAKWTGSSWQILGDYLYTDFVVANSVAHAIAVDGNGNVYVGGVFNRAVNSDGSVIDADNIAKWNKSTGRWEAVGQGVNDDVFALAVDANNNVYAGGNLTQGFNPDGASVFVWRVGKWNAQLSVWEPLGNGVVPGGSDYVTALAIDANGGVIIGGEFTSVYGPGNVVIAANHLARWNGTNWSPLGQGLTDGTIFGARVAGIAPDAAGGVYVAGDIGTAVNGDGSSVPGPVVHWDGAAWTSISSGIFTEFISKIAVDGAGLLYMLYYSGGGSFVIDLWNGASWSRFLRKQGFGGPRTITATYRYAVEHLYVGGEFTEFESPVGTTVEIANNAYWNGQRWTGLQVPGAAGEVYVIQADRAGLVKEIYVGGNFTSIDGMPASNIARFNGVTWDALGGGVNGPVYAIATVPFTQSGAFVGGAFTAAINPDGSTVSVANIAFWDNATSQWLPVGGGFDNAVYALAYARYRVYAGGAFTQVINGPTVNRVALWDFLSQQWEPLGQGVDGGFMPVVHALATGIAGSVLNHSWVNVYVGGRFTEAANSDGSKAFCRNLMLWEGNDKVWQPVGNGPDDEVLALATTSWSFYDPIYVGGRFRTAVNYDGSLENVDRIASWDGFHWKELGNGVNDAVRTIAPSFDRTQIYIGGEFTEATNSDNTVKTVNHIAAFERTRAAYVQSEWSVLGSGTNDVVHSLLSLWPCPRNSATEVLFAGGSFTEAGSKNARALAKWKYYGQVQSRGTSIVVVGSTSRGRSGGSRKSSGSIFIASGQGSCIPGLGKGSGVAQEEVIFMDLGFGETAVLPDLPYLEPFSLKIYDAEDPNTPVAVYDSLVVSSTNPQLLMLVGVDDTTAYAPNPEGLSIRETALLQDLPILTDNPGEVRTVFVHGVTDAPAIDIVTSSGDTLVRGLGYGRASQPVSLPAASYTIDLVRSSGKQKIGAYTVNLAAQANGYSVVSLTGFLDPSANQDGPALQAGVYEVPLSPITGVDERDENLPGTFELHQNFPNPFNPETSIQYSLESDQFVSLKVYDLLGREVATLVDEMKAKGMYRVRFDAAGLPSGVYFIKMKAGVFVATRKMLLIR